MINNLYIGASIAISWAWGTSLILGMQITQQKGLGAFLTWASANCLTLVFFSLLWRRGVIRREVLDKKIVKYLALLIQCFCLIVQLKVLDTPKSSQSLFVNSCAYLFISSLTLSSFSTSTYTPLYSNLAYIFSAGILISL